MSERLTFKGKLLYSVTVDGKPMQKGDYVRGNLVVDTDGGMHYITERVYWHEDYDDCDCDDSQSYHTVEQDESTLMLSVDGFDISFARLRELAKAEEEGRVVVLSELFTTPRGDHGFIYYNDHNLLMGQFYPTKEEAREKLRALAEKGDAT